MPTPQYDARLVAWIKRAGSVSIADLMARDQMSMRDAYLKLQALARSGAIVREDTGRRGPIRFKTGDQP